MYFRSLSTVLQLIVATVAWAAGAASGECSSVSALLSVESSRNATGHWLATVRLDQETQLPSRPSLLLMDVRPTISRCKGVRTDSIIVTLQGPPPPPNPDYEYFPGVGYYKYHKELLTWEDAKKSCESEDAHLLILNSETEASAIKELIQRHTKIAMGIFIGFHDKDKEGQFVTIFVNSTTVDSEISTDQVLLSTSTPTDPRKRTYEQTNGNDQQPDDNNNKRMATQITNKQLYNENHWKQQDSHAGMQDNPTTQEITKTVEQFTPQLLD